MAGRNVDPGEPRLVPFEPELPLHTNGNGSHVRARRRLMTGVVFGVLLGGLIATNYVPRLQWLNLSQIGSWDRPVIAAAAAGVLVGFFRRDDLKLAMIGGALAAVIALCGVYAIVRLSVHPLFVDRSIARVVAADLLRLACYGGPSGAAGALLARALKSMRSHPRS